MSSQLSEELQQLTIEEKRGKPKPAGRQFQLDKFKEYKNDLLTAEKHLKPRTDPIFTEIGMQINNMTSAATHLAIKRRLNEIFEKEGLFSSTPNPVEPQNENNDADSDDDNGIEIDDICNDSCIVVKLTDEERKSLQIVRKRYQERDQLRLSDGWTDALFGVLKRVKLAKCAYNFHRADIKQFEFKTVAKCGNCSGSIDIKSKYGRTEIHLFVRQGQKTEACKNVRRLTTHKAKILHQKINEKTLYETFHEQSKHIPDDAIALPGDFVSMKSLSNIKTRHNLVEGTAIHNLRTMKYTGDGAIKEVATDPLVVLFWTKQQIFCYSQMQKPCISLDATGGIIKNDTVFTDTRCCIPNTSKAPHVFLYLISLKTTDGTSVPVGQMISAQQDSTRISYFFYRWLEDFKLPKEVTIDASMALKKSCSMSFASCKNIREYLSKCFDVLMNKETELPSCYIRLDTAHFIKNLGRNKVLNKIKNKRFYLCCIGIIMKCDNFDVITQIVENMVTIANGGKNSKNCHNFLTELIAIHKCCSE